jgi:putative ABC transport system substrate-binding protein
LKELEPAAEGAFDAAIRQRAGALIAPGGPLVANRPRMVADLALKYRLPTLMDNKEFVEAGGTGVAGVGPRRIVSAGGDPRGQDPEGAKPGDLPMAPPTRLDLAVNLKTARAVGLTIPESVLIHLTEVRAFTATHCVRMRRAA